MPKKRHPKLKDERPALMVDLTRRPPRSPKVQLGGYVLLPRIIDKCRAEYLGMIGEYHHGVGMDRYFFEFVGLDPIDFKTEVAKEKSDSELLVWIKANSQHKREPWEVEAWSAYHLTRPFESSTKMLGKFASMIGRLHPERDDIKTRFDLLDLDDYCHFGGLA